MPILDLNDFRTPGTRVYSGRERGKAVLAEVNFDELEASGEPITVRVPSDTLAFNPSFFLGLFGARIRKHGRKHFEAMYKFEMNPVFIPDVEEGKQRALLESSVLGQRANES